MARFAIRHVTSYRYSKPVFLEPHVIRLRPKGDWRQRLAAYSLRVSPEPAGLSWGLDAFGNERAQAWFNGLTERLDVTVEAVVETLSDNPFDYLLPIDAQRLPPAYGPEETPALAPYLARSHPSTGPGDLLNALIDELTRDHPQAQDFLWALNSRLFDSLDKIVREEPGELSPHELLRSGRGACRDAAVLFVEACRRTGIPARFVSGYQAGDPEVETGELHAWAEAYVPGGGWRGFDPTHGIAAAAHHVVLCCAPLHAHTAPLAGAFRGTGAAAILSHDIRLRVEG